MGKLVLQKGDLSSDWGTPADLFAVVRGGWGDSPILDLASSARHNAIIGAREYFSIERPCVDAGQEIQRDGWIWCNPPAGLDSVKRFFKAWFGAVLASTRGGAFLCYQIDHWRSLSLTLDSPGLYFHIPRKRLRFVGAPSQAHFSSVVLSTRPLNRYNDFFGTVGAVW